MAILEAAKGLPGVILLLGCGWILGRHPEWVYAAFMTVLGTGAFPERGSKRELYERFLKLVGAGFVVLGIVGLVFVARTWLAGG